MGEGFNAAPFGGSVNSRKSQVPKRLALPLRLLYSGRRTGGRVVDGTALEMRRTCKGTVGSNPTLSAITRPIASDPIFIAHLRSAWRFSSIPEVEAQREPPA